MSWSKKESDIRIIDNNKHLPRTSLESELRFLQESERFVENHVRMQSRRDGVVIYGSTAVNAIVGPMFSRRTSDVDAYSHTPRKHAIGLENAIDNYAKVNISHTEEIPFVNEKGLSGKMYRVALKSFDTLADYNKMPKNIKTVNIKGVRFESLGNAELKYLKMIDEDETKRIVNAKQDLLRIHLFKYNMKKIF